MHTTPQAQVIDRHWVPLTADFEFVLTQGSSAAATGAAVAGAAAAGAQQVGGEGGAAGGGDVGATELHLTIARHLLGWLATRG